MSFPGVSFFLHSIVVQNSRGASDRVPGNIFICKLNNNNTDNKDNLRKFILSVTMYMHNLVATLDIFPGVLFIILCASSERRKHFRHGKLSASSLSRRAAADAWDYLTGML